MIQRFFTLLNTDALYGFVTFDFIVMLLIVKIQSLHFLSTDYNEFSSIRHICVDLRLPKI